MVNATLPRSDFYVYVIFRPNGIPCYVGKGHGKRWLNSAKYSSNPHLRNIYQKYGELPVIKVREGLVESDALALEIMFIAVIGRTSKGGPLVNLTDGGDGISGYIADDEFRSKVSLRFKGKPHSQERREELSKKLKGRLDFNEPGRLASPIFQRGVPLPPDILEKMRRSKIGYKHSEEAKKNMRLGQIGRKQTDESRQKIAYAQQFVVHPKLTDDQKKNLSEFVSSTKWWRTTSGRTYRSATKLNPEDISGRGNLKCGSRSES